MNMPLTRVPRPKIIYPESDGQPIAENTLQFQYIVTIMGGLDAQFAGDELVFVAGDLLWYPVEGETRISQAPDVFVAFGRPKGHRRSYLQWEEGNIAPHVVFEIWSPGNRHKDDVRKFQFYDRHGVEEYYLYDPDEGTLEGWQRTEGSLSEIPEMNGWVSPRLNVRFELVDSELRLYHPDGRRFPTFRELEEQRAAAVAQAEAAGLRAEAAGLQAEAARLQAEAAQARLEKLAAQLRAAGIEPEV